VTQGTAPPLSVGVNGKNQITNTGFCYDAAGNLLGQINCTTYVYDAENRLKQTAGVTYTYDGDGKRVSKSTGKLYWTGVGSDALDESNAAGTINEEYVFFGGKRIARLDLPSAAVHYYFADHLGSASVVTSAGGTIEEESDYYPFGGERAITSGPNNYKFTGKERDSESGLDYFGARYYAASLARFGTADPVLMKNNRLVDPQRLNLYAYGRDNPLAYVDPDGKDAIAIAFPDYKPLTPIGRVLPLGHAAIVTIDKKGHTRYFEYGRYDKPRKGKPQKGIAQERFVPAVQIGQDGKPTQQSLDNLLGYISKHYGQEGAISAEYFVTSDEQTAAMNKEAERWVAQRNDPNRAPYSLYGGPTCSTFVQDVLTAGGIKTGAHDVVPRSMIWNLELRNLLNPDAQHIDFNPEEHHKPPDKLK
jgi:RHS repeat-associated protein